MFGQVWPQNICFVNYVYDVHIYVSFMSFMLLKSEIKIDLLGENRLILMMLQLLCDAQ